MEPSPAPPPRNRLPLPLLTVRHTTTYRYRRPVGFGEHRLMLRPRDSADQRLVHAGLEISPAPAELRWMHDAFGNCVGIARFTARAKELLVVSTLQVEHREPGLIAESWIDPHARSIPFSYDPDDADDLSRLSTRHFPDPTHALDRWTRGFFRTDGPTSTLALLTAMTHRIRRQFTYKGRHEPGVQPPAETLRLGTGSCRDFAVLMMEAARSFGLAARFVSGYIHVRRDGVHKGGGNTHAWVQIYLPGAGWVEFDPTNDIVGSRDLVRVAVVRDPQQATPLSGSWMGAPGDCLGMEVSVLVTSDESGVSAA